MATQVATSIPVPVMDPLTELQTTVEMHQSRAIQMEGEVQKLEQSLQHIASLESDLQVRVSLYDVAAGDQLDRLQKEKVDIERRRQGLLSRIAAAKTELRPLEERASQLAGQQDARRQDDAVKAAYARKDALIDDILSHWSLACEAAFNLMQLVSGATELKERVVELEGVRLDEEHKRQLAAIVTSVGERLMAARAEHANQPNHYDFLYSQIFRHLEVVPARKKR